VNHWFRQSKQIMFLFMLIFVLITILKPYTAQAFTWGGTGDSFRTIKDPDSSVSETAKWFIFNPNYTQDSGKKGTNQSDYYGKNQANLKTLMPEMYFSGQRKMYAEMYQGEYLWYTTNPPLEQLKTLVATDMGYMLDNNQKLAGAGGHYLVSSSNYNIKTGSVNLQGTYQGNNTGSKLILSGPYSGKKYEYRFLGYAPEGTPIQNPYFPADVGDKNKNYTPLQFQKKWANADWIKNSWNKSYSRNLFGDPGANADTNKVKWINDIFLKTYPEFKKKGDAKYWAQYLFPLNDPTKSAGIWIGWHENGGIYYQSLVTPSPKTANLRLMTLTVKDKDGKIIGQVTRGDAEKVFTPVVKVAPKTKLSKGEEYTIEMTMKNMSVSKKAVTGTPITMSYYYNFDDDSGKIINQSVYKKEGLKTTSASKDQLKIGNTATFSYKYKVPEDSKEPKKYIQIGGKIPEKYFDKGFNFNTADDELDLEFEISPENLKVKFDGYYDKDKNPVDYVSPGHSIYVKYIMSKTAGSRKVENPKLHVSTTDTKYATKQQQYLAEGVFDKKGQEKANNTIEKIGDYAVYWVEFVPTFPKVCTQGTIPVVYAQNGVNGDPSDDVAKPPCLVNPDNIVVSNVVAKPKTTFLSQSQNSKSVTYNLKYDLTNYNYDKKNKTIPVVYTIDGKVVGTEIVPVESLKTIKVSKVLPAQNMTVGSHIVQVEANPVPRKYVEYALNWKGEEIANPYLDNIGFDKVLVEKNKDEFRCAVQHTQNTWKTTFQLSWYNGYWDTYWSDYLQQNITYCNITWRYETQVVSFYERFSIENIYFRSKTTKDKYGGWVDLLNTKGEIKAGYGFEFKVVTHYETNTLRDTPKPFGDGCIYGRLVSPGYTPVDSDHRVKVTLPFTDDSGKPIALILDGAGSGGWDNITRTFQLNPRSVIEKTENKLYINEKTKNGQYNVRVETEPFFGSYDKPTSPPDLCIVKNVTIEVKGSYLDDLNTHIIQ